MKIHENMICQACLKKSVGDTVRYKLVEHRYSIIEDPKIFRKTGMKKIIFMLIGDDVRSWSLVDDPSNRMKTDAVYDGHKPREYGFQKGAINIGEYWNPSNLFRSNIDVITEGQAEVTVKISDRAEVLHIRPIDGSLPELSIVQKTPLETVYTFEQDTEIRFSLHEHTWNNGEDTNYDLRIENSNGVDEWALRADPRENTNIISIRKRCEDPSLMTYEGELVMDATPTTFKLFDKGNAEIITKSSHLIVMDFNGETMNGRFKFERNGDIWITSEEVIS